MKKVWSLLLCLVLLLGLIPGALAAETEDAETPSTAVDEGEEFPAPPTLWEEPAEKPYVEELPVEPEDEDEAALMANTAAVTATVSFPAGTGAVGELRIYLVRAAETNAAGLVTREPSIRSQTAAVSGAGSFSVSFSNVEAGEYFFGVYSSNAELTGLSSETYYLNADGTRAAGQYTATTFRVAEGASVSRSFTLLKPARSISGTLRFTSPLPQELRLEVMANGGSANSYSYFTAPAGATQVPFSVSANETDNVYIDFYNTSTGGSWHRYCINGTLEGEWSEVAYFTPERGSVSGLVINGDALLEGAASETIPVTVTVKLPEATTERRRYNVSAFYGSSSRSTSMYVPAGSTEFKVTMGLSEGVEYTFAYRDMMGVNRTYGSETFGCRFGAESGITTLQANAKTWTFTGDSGSVVIQEPACLKITGTLDRGSFMAGGSCIGYVKAVFPDKETYTATVNFEGDSTEKTYTIYVPAAQQGNTYSLSAARAEEISSNRPLETGWTESLSGTLTGNVTAEKLSIDADGIAVSGHVELPEGVTIPAGGICVWIRDGSSGLGARYIFREGRTSADFRFTDYTDASSIHITAALENGAGMISRLGENLARTEEGFTGLSFTFRRTVTVSGTIRLPEGVRDLGANLEISAPQDSFIVTIFPGETGADYSFQTILGERVNISIHLEAESYPCLADGWYYVDTDWKYSLEGGTRPVATEDKPGVDLVLSKARLVSGTLAGDGPALRLIPSLNNNRYVTLGVEGGSGSSQVAAISEDLSWTLKVPEEQAANCRIYVSIRSDSYMNAVQGTYYYSTASGAVTDSSKASALTIPETGLSGLTVYVTTGWVLEGSLTAPAEGYLRSTSSSTSMSVYARNEETSYYGYARVEPGAGPWRFSIVVPAVPDTYTISVNGSLGSNWTTNLIFRATGEEQEISGDTTGILLPLPIARSIVTGSVFRPEDYTGYLYADIYIEMVDGEETGESYNTGINVNSNAASGSYRVLIPETETMTRYRVRVRVSSNDSYLASPIWLTETGVTSKQAEAAVFTLQTESKHDFTPIQQPSYLSGKIYIPEGIDETFSISFRGITHHSFTVNPASCPSDAKGRYYAYSLRYSSDSERTYRPYYSISTESESDLYTGSSMYILPDGTLTTNYSDAVDFTYTPGVEGTLDFTLAKSIRLSGAFTDEDGSPVRWTRGDDSPLYLYLRTPEASNASYSLQVAEDGTWTCKLPPDKTGSYYAYVRPDSGYFERVLSGTYYYSSEGKVATDQAQASTLEIGSEGLSGLTIRMNSGWLLTGRVTVPEGAYNRLKEGYSSSTYTMSIYAQNTTGGQTHYGYVTLDAGTGPWTYTLTVPKEAGTFTIRTSGSTYSAMDTNILFDRSVSADGVEVNGDTALPDLELLIAKAIIRGTVTRPEDFAGYINVRVNILTSSDELYTAYGNLYNDADSTEYTMPIPSSDTAETYRVRCNVSTSGLVSQAWLTAEGTLSKNEADAKVFTIGRDSDIHDFTLLKLPPYVSGKVYIPEEAEGTISIYLQGYRGQYLAIQADKALRDANGRYVPYALTYDGEEFDFRLSYQLSSDPSGLLLKPSTSAYFYVTEDGGFSTTYGDARIFHYAGNGFTQDLRLLQWNDWNDRFVFQSSHGAEAGTYTYIYTIPEGADSVSFRFAYADLGLRINGNSYSYYNLTNRTLTFYRSAGDQVVMVMEPSGGSKYYGFGVEEITVAGSLTAPSAPSVFTESGSDHSRILSDVKEGKTLNVIFLGDSAESVTRKALAAVYDADGRFLGMKTTDVSISSAGGVTARFGFEPDASICEIRVFLLDDEAFSPEMQQITIQAAD